MWKKIARVMLKRMVMFTEYKAEMWAAQASFWQALLEEEHRKEESRK